MSLFALRVFLRMDHGYGFTRCHSENLIMITVYYSGCFLPAYTVSASVAFVKIVASKKQKKAPDTKPSAGGLYKILKYHISIFRGFRLVQVLCSFV